MKQALERLGYPTHHSATIVLNPREAELWQAAMDAKFSPTRRPPLARAEWDALLGGFGAVSADAPACSFAPELIAAYPDAKVVLVERDVERWYPSFERTIIDALMAPDLAWCVRLDPAWLGRVHGLYARWVRGALRARDQAEMRAHARDAYREHYAEVRRLTPPERLLEFRLADGWRPLCRFLGKEVPPLEEPFPNVNESEVLLRHLASWKTLAMMNFARRVGSWVVAGAGVVAAAAWTYLRR